MPKARNSDAPFKKTETVSRHPGVTQHNINGGCLKNTPHVGHCPKQPRHIAYKVSRTWIKVSNCNVPAVLPVAVTSVMGRDRKSDKGGTIFTSRGIANLGCLFLLVAAMLMLFAGFPVLQHFLKPKQTNQGGFNLGGTNATGQVPKIPGNYGLVDKDTPLEAYTKKSYMYPDQELILVFSDEFNQDGRTFYPGEDPYWEAVDLHYWGTNDLEWYDPQQATTEGGALRLRLSPSDPVNNHNMKYRSGMIQSWNKFCFTGGLLETSVTLPGSTKVRYVGTNTDSTLLCGGCRHFLYFWFLHQPKSNANSSRFLVSLSSVVYGPLSSVTLPGSTKVSGLWPAIWAMGNLGRAGYGASLEGMWPYTYDACDVGTLPNQTFPGTQTPAAAFTGGDPTWDGVLSFLPGQRLSACTCPGESHPGPIRADGTYVGRAAPEIDVFEATIDNGVGKVSLSAQWAPYNAEYKWLNNSNNLIIYDTQNTVLNSYHGGVYQQTTSGLSVTNQDCYELEKGCFSVYGFEYEPGFDKAYITWINDGKQAWSLMGAGMAADQLTQIHARPVPQEPMYIIANLGFSENFGNIEFDKLQLPATMSIDYIRVYQPKDAVNIGCDPADFPTAKYIETYQEAYTNFNLTLWNTEQYPSEWPKNRLQEGGC
ncbi:Beta-glucan synthesis-associated protein KRE6 [Leucoagaricus sp. SymC.cos]|nr:Beta-glucan synthesis-associated protein KRE6 [Leucoagaricus sp. SymC.cos]